MEYLTCHMAFKFVQIILMIMLLNGMPAPMLVAQRILKGWLAYKEDNGRKSELHTYIFRNAIIAFVGVRY